MYLSLGLGHWELMLCTFSVIFSIVRSFSKGMVTCEGSMMGNGSGCFLADDVNSVNVRKAGQIQLELYLSQ